MRNVVTTIGDIKGLGVEFSVVTRILYIEKELKTLIVLLVVLDQQSPTFLNLRATSLVLSHVKGIQFATLF